MNPKVVEILFSKQHQEDNYPSLTFGDDIQTAISKKHLSLVLDPKLGFDKHISSKILNAIK